MPYIRKISGKYRRNKVPVQVKHANYVKNTNIENKERNMEKGQQKPNIKGN